MAAYPSVAVRALISIRSSADSCSARSSCSGASSRRAPSCPFAFEEHVERRGPSLYELRPLVRAFIEEREPMLRAREDARLAVEELRREPAAAIFARAHAGTRASEDEALFRTVLLGLLISTAEACGGFDWDDEAFETRATPSSRHRSSASGGGTSPSRRSSGISLAKPVELAPGLSVRPFVDRRARDALARVARAPPADFGREPDRSRRRRAAPRARRRRGAARRGRRDRRRGRARCG